MKPSTSPTSSENSQSDWRLNRSEVAIVRAAWHFRGPLTFQETSSETLRKDLPAGRLLPGREAVTFDPNFDLSPAVNARRVSDRTIQEMLGLVKGMVCDGVVSEEECISFGRWLRANQPAISTWPGNILARRLESIYEDGVIDATERHELYELLCDTVGDGGNDKALDENGDGMLRSLGRRTTIIPRCFTIPVAAQLS